MRFGASKIGLSTHVVFLLTVPRLYLCCSFSLLMSLCFHIWRLFCPYSSSVLRETEIKESSETVISSSYLDIYFYSNNGKLTTRIYDRRNNFDFPIVNFPLLSSNILSALAYSVFGSQLIRYARACSEYQDLSNEEN